VVHQIALNLDAKVVVATLETQRGRFLRGEGPGSLVMDEFQMLGDPMRGALSPLAFRRDTAGQRCAASFRRFDFEDGTNGVRSILHDKRS
jgi:hypothetical protein